METPSDVARMRLVGGVLALDFVNTRVGPPKGPPDDDLLTDYGALLAWSRYAGVLDDGELRALERASQDDPGGAASVFQRALHVRDYLHEMFTAITDGGRPDSRELGLLRDDECEALRSAQLADGEPFSWSWSDDLSIGRPLRPIVHSAVHLLSTGPLDRIKRCAGCSDVFLDESKNRSRRWCSMDDCGATEKARRYVAARRGRRGRTAQAD